MIPLDLCGIRWAEQTAEFRGWLARHAAIAPAFLTESREAGIWGLSTDDTPAYVIKRWKPGQRVDAAAAYRLLQNLAGLHLPAVRSAGWGVDVGGSQVLAMRDAGRAIDRAATADVETFAGTLALIHRAPIQRVELSIPTDAPAFFARVRERFFEGVDAFADLASLLRRAQDCLPPVEPVLLHGDYHLGNVTKRDGGLCVLDWSEAQVGDWRYDFAWAELLTLIYTGVWAHEDFVRAYAAASGRDLEGGVRPYEIMAAVRWLLLSRTAPFPVPVEWRLTAHRFIQSRLPAAMRAILAAPSA